MGIFVFTDPIGSGGGGAVGDGLADDGPAVSRWRTFAQNETTAGRSAQLQMAVPSNFYKVDSDNLFYYTNPLAGDPSNPISNMGTCTIGGITSTRVKVSSALFVTHNCFYETPTSAAAGGHVTGSLLNTCLAGATSVKFITGSETSNYFIGQWVLISGLTTQRFGLPLDFQRWEFNTVANVVGDTVFLNNPLRFNYSSTWPYVPAPSSSHGRDPDQGGPAAIFPIHPWWDATLTVNNFEVLDTSIAESAVGTRIQVYNNLKFNGANKTCVQPSFATSITYTNCALPGPSSTVALEVDKLVDYLEFNNCTDQNAGWGFQSMSIYNCLIHNCPAVNFLAVGLPYQLTIDNCTIGQIQMGTGYGALKSLTITNSTIWAAIVTVAAMTGVPPNTGNVGTSYEYLGNGLFRALNRDTPETYQVCMPGSRFAFAWNGGGGQLWTASDNLGVVRFCITNVYNDDNYVYIQTDIPDPGTHILPRPTFNGGTAGPNMYYHYPYPPGGITQSGTVAGINVATIQDTTGVGSVLADRSCPVSTDPSGVGASGICLIGLRAHS